MSETIENNAKIGVTPGQGGVGSLSLASGDLIYANSATTFTTLNATASGNALLSGSSAPSWGKIGLSSHVSGTLPIANGGTNQTSYTNGQLLIGNASGSLSKATLTAGSNISITNGDGSITIASTASGGLTPTEYDTPGTYTYNVPAGASYLNVILQGAGSGGSGASSGTGSSSCSGTGGSAGIWRQVMIPTRGATSATVVVGTGGAGSTGRVDNLQVSNSTAGGQTSITMNGKLTVAAGGGASGGPNSSTNLLAPSGGSAGTQAGGNATNGSTTAGTAGSATIPAGQFFNLSIAGVAGATGNNAAATTLNGIAGTSGGTNINVSSYVIGGSGSTGCRGVGGALTSGAGGQCQGGGFVGQTQNGATGFGAGGQGGCSAMASGGLGATSAADAQTGTYGSGGGGGACVNSGTYSTRIDGQRGGHGYVRIIPM